VRVRNELLLICCFSAALSFNDRVYGANDGYSPLVATVEQKTFLAELSDAAEKDNAEWVADHVSYPLRVNINGQKENISNRQNFISNFSSIFNEKVRHAIREQKPDELIRGSGGVRIGNGVIWFESVYRNDEDAKERKNARIIILGINN
jgi:hypothetical protein